ncbi:MAG: hypothetical protein UR30_C0005G0092 [Candidatus Peregrinibacteria bacterium GW2011_GWC2_33_13]|nr:MAG: hypothetical protein UR30_C0005G0092 [Candidatus Peregrinibacteria bacterium GW2011_GWC2_33_13]
MTSLFDLQIAIKAIDQASGVFRKVSKELSGIGKAANAVRSDFKNTLEQAGILGLKFGAIAGGIGWAFKSQFVDTASQFEKFSAILETVEGSSKKAKGSMGWVSDFAAKTPYELDQVMDAYVKLKSYGMDPVNGLLTSLGDTSSAMGKPLMQAVEAIADAVTGENERLKEFGIKARIQKNNIVYEYTDMGKTMTAVADKSNRAMIQSVLTGIFNAKYAGAMEKQSKTWGGIMSNIADQWTRFKTKVMAAGVFDYLKNKLQGVLDYINKLAETGKLDIWAKQIGKNVTNMLDKIFLAGIKTYNWLKTVIPVIQDIVKKLGGLKNICISLAVIISAQFILSVASLIKSFATLGLEIYSTGRRLLAFSGIQKTYETTILSLYSTEYKLKNATDLMKISWLDFSNAIKNKGGFAGFLNYQLLISRIKLLEWASSVKMMSLTSISAFRGASLAALSFTGAILTNPITLAIAGIAVVFAGIFLLIRKYWKPISGFFKGMWQGLIEGLAPILPKFKILAGVFSPILTPLKAVWNWLKKLVQPVNDTGGAAEKMGVKFGKALARIITFTASLPFKMFNFGAKIIEMFAQGIISKTQMAVNAIKNIVQKIRDYLPHSPAKIGPLKDLNKIRLVETIAETIKPKPINQALNKVLSPSKQNNSAFAGIKNQNSSNSVVVHYNPIVSINGASPQEKEEFLQMLKQHKDEILRIVKAENRRNMRLAY